MTKTEFRKEFVLTNINYLISNGTTLYGSHEKIHLFNLLETDVNNVCEYNRKFGINMSSHVITGRPKI